MEKKLQGETNANPMANLAFPDQIPSTSSFNLPGIFDFSSEAYKGSLGFMEMLGGHDYGSDSLFDLLQTPSLPPIPSPASTMPESSEVVNTPATPNSSSVSSSSTEAANEDQQQQSKTGEDEDREKTKKQ
jgi:hypothetical protein